MTISELRKAVILREKMCTPARLDKSHACRDKWGFAHLPTDLDKLTLGHVREEPGGQRRDDPGWCIAQCAASNRDHWESANAAIVRAYLQGIRIAEASPARTRAIDNDGPWASGFEP